MTKNEVIDQLESLLDHCKTMRESGEIWARGCEALRIALAALRGPTREQVEKWRSKWIYSRTTTINHLAVVQCSNPKCGHEAFAYMQYGNFCPYCGAPMTDEAVEIVIKRLEALNEIPTAT